MKECCKLGSWIKFLPQHEDFICFVQYVSEKIGGAKGTELDDEFTDMERVIKLLHFCHSLFVLPQLSEFTPAC